MREFFFMVLESGKLPEGIKHTLARVIPEYAGKYVRLTLEEKQESPSDKQRRYYFGVIVEAYIEHFKANGKILDKDQMHDSMMKTIGGFNNAFVDPFTGEPDEGRLSINDLTKAQAEGYFTLCRKWAAENGFDIPEPNEY